MLRCVDSRCDFSLLAQQQRGATLRILALRGWLKQCQASGTSKIRTPAIGGLTFHVSNARHRRGIVRGRRRLAGFVILSGNRNAVAPETLGRLEVVESIKEGVTVHSSSDDDIGARSAVTGTNYGTADAALMSDCEG